MAQIYANNVSGAIYCDVQIAASQQIFSTTASIVAAGGGAPSTVCPPPPEYLHGTHQAAVMDSQIATSSRVFHFGPSAPSAVGLGTGRDFVVTQDEPTSPGVSSIITNTALLSSAGVQSPLLRPAIITFPQYPQDQVWSVVVTPAPAPAAPAHPPPIRFLQPAGVPQIPQDQAWSTIFPVSPFFIPRPPLQLTSCGVLSFYDFGNGDVLLAWGPFGGGIPDSYNVYVNEVFFTNVTIREAVLTGLLNATYSRGAVAPTPNNSTRPQSMPPVGVVTPSSTYSVRVVAVSAGFEVSPSDYGTITAQPTSDMLTTPMKRIFPFPNTGLD